MTSVLLLLGGSIGAGKTTLAYQLAKKNPAGIVVIENDTIRRELLGFPLNYFMNQDLDDSFSAENNQRVIQTMNERTTHQLHAGKTVIRCHVDVSENDTTRFQKLYPDTKVICVYLLAPIHIIHERLAKRKYERDTLTELSVEQGHASDADANVLLKFPVRTEAPKGWHMLDATLSIDELDKQLSALILQEAP